VTLPDEHDVTLWTIPAVLARQARDRPDKAFVTVGPDTLSYGEAHASAGRVASMLNEAGVGHGDHVAVMLPNGLTFCHAWLGLARLGAVHVAINTDYKGSFLTHVLNNCRARTLIVDPEHLAAVDEIRSELAHLETVYVAGGGGDDESRALRPFEDFRDYPEVFSLRGPDYRDTGCVMYTSGTTGPSKGVLMPHAHLYLCGLGTIEHMGLDAEDVFYIVLPLFHANGLFMQLYATMIAGASAVVRGRFSAGEWIGDIARHGVTITNCLGAVAAFVLNRPPSDLDHGHSLRALGLAPVSENMVKRLKERFGIPEVYGMYGMTEVNIPLYTPPGPPKPDSCGRVWTRYFDLRIVDAETDETMPPGETGEIVVRPKQPFGFMAGYLDMPGKTVEAWRNFWFHTGDAGRMDEDGDVFFVDRIKDCIRRRGENISSFEVENALAAHPGVREVAVYAVPSEIEGAEDEVMAAVVTGTDERLDVEALTGYAAENVPSFAVPRFYRTVDALPKTPTGKVQKHVLRADGLTADTVDTSKATG